MTDLCVPIFVQSSEQARRDITTAAAAGADLVELRIDALTEVEEAGQLALDSIVPCIVTCRPEWEGGNSTLANPARLKLLDRMLIGKTRYVDVELETVRSEASTLAMPMIVSSHDFKNRPARLTNILLEMNEGPGVINKIVWMARSIRDNIEAFEILQQRQKPTIALCMGEAGLISRVLAKKFGAFLTFASLRDESATAPGQVTIHDMKRLYRWDSINANTKVYGVVASPVMHSMSPAIHNAGFGAVGHDGVYLPLLVNPGYESFKAFMESFLAFEPLHLCGLSVTLPHKENALRYLKEKGAQVEELAERIGAVNTILIERDGPSPSPGVPGEGERPPTPASPSPGKPREEVQSRAHSSPSPGKPGEGDILRGATGTTVNSTSSPSPRNPGEGGILRGAVGTAGNSASSPSPGTPGEGRGEGLRLRGINTDYAAILDTITTSLGITREQLADKRIAVIGAGGTGRTAVAALAECGATVVVYNRTQERADVLAKEFNGRRGKVVSARMEKLRDNCCHVLINTTSVGMHPNIDASPLGDEPPPFAPDMLVFDTIYNPMETKLLKQAKAAGARTVGGVEMFVRQAARQFEAWTGHAAPIDIMRSVIEQQLTAT